jgi:hypothetical protein
VAVVDGVLYAFGGVDANDLTAAVEAYDPRSNTWTTKMPMPAPRCSMIAGAVDGRIFIVGGQESRGAVGTVEVYDPDADSWSDELAALPSLRLNFGGDVLKGRVFVAGGYPIPSGSDLGATEAYDPYANGWTTEVSMPTPRRNLAAAVTRGVFYAVGGGDDSNVLPTLEAFTPEATFASVCDPGTGGVIACPCMNPAGGPGRGCDNSAATGGAILWVSGIADLSSDSLVFTTSGEKPTATSILLQGTAPAPAGIAYGQGVRCVSGTLNRLFIQAASGGSITAPNFGAGDPTVSARSAAKGDTILAGQSRWYVVDYRDPTVLGGCAATRTLNATPTGQVTWSP